MSDAAGVGDREFAAAETVCPFCGVGCGIQYDGADTATGWEAAVDTRGEVCPTGAAACDVVDHPDRLTTTTDGRLPVSSGPLPAGGRGGGVGRGAVAHPRSRFITSSTTSGSTATT
jgi:hypothetical protein